MKRAFLSLLLLFSTAPFAQSLLSDVQQSVVNAPIIKGEFHQTRALIGVNKKLISEGYFLVDKSKGILWVTEKPFPQTVKITQSELQIQNNSQVVMRLNSESQPGIKYINELLLSIFSGNIQIIEKMFDINGQSTKKGWSLHLTPKKSGPSILRNVDLAGKTVVDFVSFETNTGDLTQINFSKVKTPDSLSPDEAAKFN
ncbi:outer membrane lipoprotein carrier protein LolA [Polynucleobacter sp.]|uniref:outer membrane lipoprotein carrier protein LolA n=1 Tax=Polynucleobacter sp. TaxID=2029855 RepID=UPI0037C8C657